LLVLPALKQLLYEVFINLVFDFVLKVFLLDRRVEREFQGAQIMLLLRVVLLLLAHYK